jgi:DNA-binding IclR family transcriptional regulator
VVLSLILFSGVEGDSFPPRQPVPLNVAKLSRDAGISRAQVRRMLRDAEQDGFFDLRTDGEVRFTPQLYENLETLTAGVTVIFRECARRTLEHLAE